MGNVRLVSPQAYDVRVVPTPGAPGAPVVPPGAINARTIGLMEVQAGFPPTPILLVPGNEIWHIEDIFVIPGDGTPNMRLELSVNGTPQPMTPTLGATAIVAPTRLKLPRSIMIPQAGSLAVNFVLVAVLAASSAVACHIKIMRYPVG